MKLNNKIQSFVSAEAKAALAAGKGKRVVGISNGAKVGDEFEITGIDFNTRYIRPDAIERDAWNAMSDTEKQEKGRKIEFFVFETNTGELSVSALLTPHDDVTTWDSVLEGADVLADAYRPKTRKIEAFLNSAEMEVLLDGKHKLVCIATAETQSENQTFATRHKLFKLVEKA